MWKVMIMVFTSTFIAWASVDSFAVMGIQFIKWIPTLGYVGTYHEGLKLPAICVLNKKQCGYPPKSVQIS